MLKSCLYLEFRIHGKLLTICLLSLLVSSHHLLEKNINQLCYLISFKSTGILPVIDGHSSANSELLIFSNNSFLPYLQSFVFSRKLHYRKKLVAILNVSSGGCVPQSTCRACAKILKRWVQKIAGVPPLYSLYSLIQSSSLLLVTRSTSSYSIPRTPVLFFENT